MQFVVDTQLPPALARWLSSRGHPSIHTTERPDGHLLTDRKIVDLAIQEGRHIVTKDHDFFESFMVKGAPPAVLLLEYGNCSNRDLLHKVEEQWNLIEEPFNKGAGLVVAGKTAVAVWN